jgi:peptidoglycan hydrolase-like protein with peptidoglycan-binding domain
MATALGIAVVVNALALQAPPALAPMPQPAPAFRASAAAPAAARTRQTEVSGVPQILVKAIQTELKRRGIFQGEVNGVLGPNTEAAIRSYQVVAGLSPTGQPSQSLLKTLSAVEIVRMPAPPPANPTAQPVPAPRPSGQLTAQGLQQVQRVLAEQGFGPLKIDGVFGEATRGAIRRFEKSHGLPVEGEITSRFLNALRQMTGAKLPGL